MSHKAGYALLLAEAADKNGYSLLPLTGADVIDVISKVCGRGVFEVVAA